MKPNILHITMDLQEKKNNQELGKSLATLNQDRENEVESLKQMLVKERLEHAQAVELKEEQTQLYLKSQDAVKALSKRLEDQVLFCGYINLLSSCIKILKNIENLNLENIYKLFKMLCDNVRTLACFDHLYAMDKILHSIRCLLVALRLT